MGSIEFDNKIPSEVQRFQKNMAQALAKGMTVANNKIDVPIPGEATFDVPEEHKGKTGFGWGPHIAKPTGPHGGLSHVQKQAQARSVAMLHRNKPKSVVKKKGSAQRNNGLSGQGFEAQIGRLVMV